MACCVHVGQICSDWCCFGRFFTVDARSCIEVVAEAEASAAAAVAEDPLAAGIPKNPESAILDNFFSPLTGEVRAQSPNGTDAVAPGEDNLVEPKPSADLETLPIISVFAAAKVSFKLPVRISVEPRKLCRCIFFVVANTKGVINCSAGVHFLRMEVCFYLSKPK